MRTTREAKRDAGELWRLCLVNGRSDGRRVKEITEQLLKENRVGAQAVLAQFVRLARLDAARWSAHVESAVALSGDDRTAIFEGVAECCGRPVETTFSVDPSLIGGVRVTVGSEVIDGSIRGRLAALEAGL
jgi:F-type H+-transporting ATPase subunit delta